MRCYKNLNEFNIEKEKAVRIVENHFSKKVFNAKVEKAAFIVHEKNIEKFNSMTCFIQDFFDEIVEKFMFI